MEYGLRKRSCIIALVLVIVLLIIIGIQGNIFSRLENPLLQELKECKKSLKDAANARTQRNEVAKLLNNMKKEYGQQSCNMLIFKKEHGAAVKTHVSENGGWCADKSGPNSTDHMIDEGLAKTLSKFLIGKKVGSFGDGPGDYKRMLDQLDEVKSYSAYDGAPFCESTTGGIVQFLDLTAPQFGIPIYDWIVSLEVAEHIPEKFEDVFLDNIARHARQGVILSWAVPGQDGLSHVNNKPLPYVITQMEKRGFDIVLDEGKLLRQASTFEWFKRNIHVYRRKSTVPIIEEEA